jgi:hypothetical protein
MLRGLLLFFILSKTIGVLLLPTTFLIGAGVLGAILMATRFASLGRKLMIASFALLAFCGFAPLGSWLLYPLEPVFLPGSPPEERPTALSCSAVRSLSSFRWRTGSLFWARPVA